MKIQRVRQERGFVIDRIDPARHRLGAICVIESRKRTGVWRLIVR